MQKRIEKVLFIIIALGLVSHGILQINKYYLDIVELEEISSSVPFQKGMSFTTWSNQSYNTDWVGTPLINGPAEFTEKYPVKIKWTTEAKKYCQKNDILFCVKISFNNSKSLLQLWHKE